MKKYDIRNWGIFLLLSISQLPNSFSETMQWESHLELSYVNTAGNTNTETASAKLDIQGTCNRGNRYFFRSTFLTTKDDGEQKANKLTSEIRVERVFSGRLFGFIGVNYLRDKFSGYNHRISVGPGLGLDIIKRQKYTLKSLFSATYFYEKYSVKPSNSNQFTSAKTAIHYEWSIKEKVTYKASGNYAVSLKNSKKYYINGETSLEVGISSKISVGISYLINYQNLPPSSTIKTTDTSFLTSLILNL